MNDPDHGAKALKNGAAGGGESEGSDALPARGAAHPDRANSKPVRSGRHSHRAKGCPDKHTGGPVKSPADGETTAPRPKKKRKRRRGRKVFAREGAGANGVVQTVSPAAVLAGLARPPRHLATVAGAGNAPAMSVVRGGVAEAARRNGDAPVYAALDLGTNNCRLLVAIPGRPGQFRVIDAFSRIVRLGEGLSSCGYLSQAAMDRAVEALKVCSDKLGARNVRKARLIATEACRSAGNGAEFIARVKAEANLTLEIIDRKTEARLAVSGCGPLVERGTEGVVLFDIGGGSSEIALIDLSRQRTPRLANHIVSWTSLPLGVVSLAERFGGRHVTPAVFEAMVAEVARLLEGFEGRERLAHLASGRRFHLLGTSGTVTTLAGVHLGLERYDRRRVDGLWMENSDVDAMIERLVSWDFEQRVANPCIGADRADLVLAGCAILEAIRRHWPSERLRVADRGLREGMLSELMADDGVWRRNRREVFSR